MAALALTMAKVESVPQISNKSKIYILCRCGSSCALEIQQTSEISGKNVVYLAGKRQGEDSSQIEKIDLLNVLVLDNFAHLDRTFCFLEMKFTKINILCLLAQKIPKNYYTVLP